MEKGEKPIEDENNDIPDHIDPYRFWFTQEFERSGIDNFILPFLITADDSQQLRQRYEKLKGKLNDQVYLPEFYEKLYFNNGKSSRAEGPYQMVVLVKGGGAVDALVKDIEGVVASGMPTPAPIWPDHSPEKRPASARLSEYLTPGRKVRKLVALIDTDIAFANARFRQSPHSTRIGWYWDMDASAYPGFGRMMARSQIDAYLAGLSPGGNSEMQLYLDYARDSYLNPWEALPPPMFGHGTGVLDAAVGGQLPGDGDDIDLVCVQLPRFAVAQTHGQFLWLYVLMGLDLISYLAWMIEQEQGERPETLVNISVGGHGGRHDGYSGLEMAMDSRIRNGNLQAIYLAAGNSFQERIHAAFTGETLHKRQDLIWRIQPDDGTSSFLEIWLPTDKPQQLELTITVPGQPPLNIPATDIRPGYTTPIHADGQEVAKLSVQSDPLYSAPGVPKRLIALLSVKSTALSRAQFIGSSTGLPQIAGDWIIGLKHGPKLKAKGIVTLWISRDDEILRLPTGARQSFFTDYSPAAENVVKEGTISDMASGRETTVCAAHWASDRMMTPYSGRGIPRKEAVAKRNVFPLASYVADESEAHEGVTVSGYFSGSAVTMRGTSVSSPLVLRLALTGDLPPGPGSIRKRVGNLAASQEAALPVHDNPVKASAQNRETSEPEDYGKGRLEFMQHPLGQPGSTNYPRRRRNSI
ncbi:hypothetical protein [Paracoccus tegillarcae]|uniref:Peptidase S8/S53 domain-containing protein n=1 Tax=Paracoccus tegillarcae TaxID=1529068 RepID=A0A2K9EJ42_9RHOB|nr:hypothetical protein [Paracoccus tegillarcae]AUH35010.1 hypothetical protein CUV01_17970 [Paracoccus tegillarcae]